MPFGQNKRAFTMHNNYDINNRSDCYSTFGKCITSLLVFQ